MRLHLFVNRTSGLIIWLILAYSSITFAQPTTDFTFTPDNPCAGVSVTFTNLTTSGGGGAITYLWDFGDGETSTQTSPSHTFNPPAGDGIQYYFVKLTAKQGAVEVSETKSIGVKMPPSTLLIDPFNQRPFSKCTGTGNFALTVQNSSTTSNASYTINWGNGSPNFNASSFSQASETYTNKGIYNLQFTVVGQNGCSSSQIYTVLYGSNPSIGITGPDGTVGCAPLSLTYTISDVSANLGTSYSFTFNDGSETYQFNQSSVPSSLTHIFTSASCGAPNNSFSLVARAENQCGHQQLIVEPISIDREPIAQFSSVDSICIGDPITFNNTTVPPCGVSVDYTNYTWTIEGVDYNVGISKDPYVHTFNTSGEYTVVLRAANAAISHCNSGISTYSKKIVVINSDIPPAPVITGPLKVCQGQQGVILNSTKVDFATTYTWELPQGVSIVSGGGTNSIVVNIDNGAPAGEVEFYVTGSNKCNTGIKSDVFKFTINPLPGNPGNIAGETSICQGQEFINLYEVNPIDNALSYIWSIPDGTQIVSPLPHTNAVDIRFPVGVSSGFVTVKGQNACGFGSEASTFVAIQYIPIAAGGILGVNQICEGESTTFTVPAIQYAVDYVWTVNGEAFAPTNSNSISVTFDEDGQTTISVYGKNPCGEGISSFKTIVVNPAPEPVFDPQNHCFGQPIPLYPDQKKSPKSNIISWQWDFGDGYSSSKENPIHNYDKAGNYDITLKVVTADGCPGTETKTVTVYPLPAAYFRGFGLPSLNPIRPGISRMDKAFNTNPVRASMVSATVSFVDSTLADDATEGTMNPARINDNAFWRYEVGELDQANQSLFYEGIGARNIQHKYSKPGKYVVKQIVESAFGCSDSSFLEVQIVEAVFIPNTFFGGSGDGNGGVDGGDGSLKIFKPIIGYEGDDIDYDFSIYNKWGEQIFASKSVAEGWDGTIRGGQAAPGGIYVWRLRYKLVDGEPVYRTGTVLLLR